MPVKPTPARPAPAATLVLLRDRPDGAFDVLLIRRHDASRFAAGDFVFPGGKIEADDNPDDAAAWCAGLDPARAARVLGLEADPRAALRYWIGAIRETFEEAGILLASGPGGAPVPVGEPRFTAYRRACHADNRAFWEMVRAERLTLATGGLVYFAHWITPDTQPLRFDTRFFAAPAPAGQDAVADEREITEVRWLTPRAALDASGRGELSLRRPTMTNLALFDGAASAAEALARLDGRPVSTIQPRVVMVDGERRIFLPGDPGY
ncbi:MAG: NUDIX domain-containing protein [Candidatus Rokubacteria bacterium]|nr:NUDIX domain-containing protein [Candidatus Rokubacteria bacterium]